MVDILDEYFAVTDLARACRTRDRVDDTFNEAGRDHDLNLDLWKKGRGIFGAAVDLGIAQRNVPRKSGAEAMKACSNSL